jgi:hypothetical protein
MRIRKTTILAVSACLCLTQGCFHVHPSAQSSSQVSYSLSHEMEERVLALDPESLSEKDVSDVLARCPSPRIVALNGSVPIVTMESFGKFLVLMGYPEGSVRNPQNGSYSYSSSHRNSQEMAGMVAWYYEQEGMRPMVIGHSQGGMLSVKILHELAGAFHERVAVWNPRSGKTEARYSIIDPLDGRERPVIGLKLGFASAIATGKGMRILLGQWGMVSRLRRTPDTVEEFTGFHVQYDLLSGTLFGMGEGDWYIPLGSSKVRNVVLPPECGHLGVPVMEHLAKNPATRQWIQSYLPARGLEEAPDFRGEDRNILLAAELWHSIKKHWCLELKRFLLSKRKRSQG